MVDFCVSASVSVCFYFIPGDSSGEQSQQKPLDDSRVTVLISLPMVVSPASIPSSNYRCWVRTVRSDNWIGLIPVLIRHIQLDPIITMPPPPPGPDGAIPTQVIPPVTGMVTYLPLTIGNGALDGEPVEERHLAAARLDQVFCDASSLSIGTLNVFEDMSWTNVINDIW